MKDTHKGKHLRERVIRVQKLKRRKEQEKSCQGMYLRGQSLEDTKNVKRERLKNMHRRKCLQDKLSRVGKMRRIDTTKDKLPGSKFTRV